MSFCIRYLDTNDHVFVSDYKEVWSEKKRWWIVIDKPSVGSFFITKDQRAIEIIDNKTFGKYHTRKREPTVMKG